MGGTPTGAAQVLRGPYDPPVIRNTNQLVEIIAQQADIEEVTARAVVTATFAIITSELAAGRAVTLSDFGKFSVLLPASRKGIDPSTDDLVEIPSAPVLRFAAARALKDAVDAAECR